MFGLVKFIVDETGGLSLDEIDIIETRARYCRCIYETVDKEMRLDVFSEAMELYANRPFDRNMYIEEYPLLQDVIDSRA